MIEFFIYKKITNWNDERNLVKQILTEARRIERKKKKLLEYLISMNNLSNLCEIYKK